MRKLWLCAFAPVVLMLSLVVFPWRAWAQSGIVESEFETNQRVSTEVIENTLRSRKWRARGDSNSRPSA